MLENEPSHFFQILGRRLRVAPINGSFVSHRSDCTVDYIVRVQPSWRSVQLGQACVLRALRAANALSVECSSRLGSLLVVSVRRLEKIGTLKWHNFLDHNLTSNFFTEEAFRLTV